MSHHLHFIKHFQLHQEHKHADGSHVAWRRSHKLYVNDFEEDVQQKILATHPDAAQQKYIELTIEVCMHCGYIEPVTCEHGLSYWTHRPGCSLYVAGVEPLPPGLVREYSDKLFPNPTEHCGGCLLLCPFCKNDGT